MAFKQIDDSSLITIHSENILMFFLYFPTKIVIDHYEIIFIYTELLRGTDSTVSEDMVDSRSSVDGTDLSNTLL